MTGRIARIHPRGFCFIAPEPAIAGCPRDVFAHAKAFENIPFDQLVEGTYVDFELDEDAPQPRACSVVVR